ncbi:hypothetical protein AVEN_198168-1 [Araneus ventricosus]|uniref:Uncharacterized protein n=1 Tax=Araneus ventricosus TaxID=182803 RepID=A0A4Y2GHT9_ARAVE|nr:hypothetical protein AVEN_198168-1 [Araneus ventricosus]
MYDNIYEVIDVLNKKGRIIDVFALAGLPIPYLDPVIFNLLLLIRKKNKDLNNSVREANYYISMNDTLMGVRILGFMPDASCVKSTADICKDYNKNDTAEKYEFILMKGCLIQNLWESIK